MVRYRLPKDRRIKGKSNFQLFFGQSARVENDMFRMYYAHSPVSRFAVIAGKKLGSAVTRNRLKRRLREAYRLVVAQAPPVEVVLVARPTLLTRPFSEVTQQLTADLKRAAMAASC